MAKWVQMFITSKGSIWTSAIAHIPDAMSNYYGVKNLDNSSDARAWIFRTNEQLF